MADFYDWVDKEWYTQDTRLRCRPNQHVFILLKKVYNKKLQSKDVK